MWNYPDGYREIPSMAHYCCNNEDCPNCGNEWEVEGYTGAAGFYPANESDILCPECGEEGE